MESFFATLHWTDILKWIAIVLLAGFIGQFGKSLSLHIIDLCKRRKKRLASTEVPNQTYPSVQAATEIKQREKQAKADKKAVKTQVKAMKKLVKSKNDKT